MDFWFTGLFTITDTRVTLAAMKPKDAEQFWRSSHSGTMVGILAVAIPLALFIALRWVHVPKLFRQVSIVSQSPDEPWATLARMAREDAALIRRAHSEMIALTLVALILLSFLFSRSGIPKWTKYLLSSAAAASLAVCLLQW
jgi:hypothetical protein